MVRIRFWKKKKSDHDIAVSRLLDESSDILIEWIHPGNTRLISEVEQDGTMLLWKYQEKDYGVQIQTGPYRSGNDLKFFVRGDEPHTFNPFLQANFDPEYLGRFEGIALQYYKDKGIQVTDDFKTRETGYWITNALLGVVGRNKIATDFFNALRESKWMLLIKMAAGVAIWEMVQQLVILVGENF